MKKGGSGRIVNSTSSSIKQELDNLILSNTFRMGVVGMSKTMSREFGPYNIMVNTMGPGRIYTDRIKYLNTIRAEKAGITLEEYNPRAAASFRRSATRRGTSTPAPWCSSARPRTARSPVRSSASTAP